MMEATIKVLGLAAPDRIALAEKIHQGLPTSQVKRFLRAASMTQDQLLQAAQIPLGTGRRRFLEKRFSPHESERIARIARVYDRAAELFSRPGRPLEWMSAQNPRLGGRRPIDVAGTELGAQEVEALLGRIAHGVY